MKIKYKVKQAGSKRASLTTGIIDLGKISETPSLSELLEVLATNQARSFNGRKDRDGLISALMGEERGKIGFNRIFNRKAVDSEKAVETVIQAYEDGLFTVFCNDEQIGGLDERVNLSRTPVLTFIRLTFLAGSIF